MLCSIAELEFAGIEAVRTLEEKLGKMILALKCHEVKPETITDEELSQLQELEEKLGITLVAITWKS